MESKCTPCAQAYFNLNREVQPDCPICVERKLTYIKKIVRGLSYCYNHNREMMRKVGPTGQEHQRNIRNKNVTKLKEDEIAFRSQVLSRNEDIIACQEDLAAVAIHLTKQEEEGNNALKDIVNTHKQNECRPSVELGNHLFNTTSGAPARTTTNTVVPPNSPTSDHMETSDNEVPLSPKRAREDALVQENKRLKIALEKADKDLLDLRLETEEKLTLAQTERQQLQNDLQKLQTMFEEQRQQHNDKLDKMFMNYNAKIMEDDRQHKIKLEELHQSLNHLAEHNAIIKNNLFFVLTTLASKKRIGLNGLAEAVNTTIQNNPNDPSIQSLITLQSQLQDMLKNKDVSLLDQKVQ